MYVDNYLLFSDAQAVTAAAASTNYIDVGATRDLGTGEDLYVVATLDVAMTDGSSDSTLAVYLYGDSTTTFTPDGSDLLFTFPATSAAGTTLVAKLAPGMAALAYRYLELYYSPANGNLSTGSVTAFITKDINRFYAHAKGYTIS